MRRFLLFFHAGDTLQIEIDRMVIQERECLVALTTRYEWRTIYVCDLDDRQFFCSIISRTKSDPHCWAVLILSLFIGASYCTFNLFIYSSVSTKKQTQNMSNRRNVEEFL